MAWKENDEDKDKKSKFNTGVSKLIRLDFLWQDASRHARNGSYQKWNEDLDCIWSELAADLKEVDFDKDKKQIDKFDKEIVELGQLNDKEQQSFGKISDETIKKRAKHYAKIREKEMFLRRLENFLGKGTAWEDDEADDF